MTLAALIGIFVSSFLFAIAAVVSPGPIMTAIVSQTPRRGWTVGPLIATGHSFTELVIIILLAVGLASGLNSPGVQITIALLGGGLLTWMGSDMVLGALRGKIRLPGASADADTLNNGQLVRLGVLTTLSNPFWYAWWVTAVPNYLVELDAVLPVSIAAFYFGHISADFAWDSMLSGIVAGGRRWITDGVYRSIIFICGAFFLYLGLKFLVQGIGMI
jgi:threonine/homoserine/homoserine lactone efflux protein